MDAVYTIQLPKEDRKLLDDLPEILVEVCRKKVESEGGHYLWTKYKNISFEVEWI